MEVSSSVLKSDSRAITPATARSRKTMHVNHTTHFCKGRRRIAPLYASPYTPAMAKHNAIPTVMKYGSGCHSEANVCISGVIP